MNVSMRGGLHSNYKITLNTSIGLKPFIIPYKKMTVTLGGENKERELLKHTHAHTHTHKERELNPTVFFLTE